MKIFIHRSIDIESQLHHLELLRVTFLCLGCQMSERAATAAAAAAAGQSVVRGVSAHREKAGLNASAEGVREMNL